MEAAAPSATHAIAPIISRNTADRIGTREYHKRLMLATLLSMFLAAGADPQAAPRGVAVAGVVQDQTGAVLPAAQVELVGSGVAEPAQTVATDRSGRFGFERVPPGTYDVRTAFPGFKGGIARVRVGTRPPGQITVVMEI